MPEELAALPEDAGRTEEQSAELTPAIARPPADGATAAEPDALDLTQVGETAVGADFTQMSIAELLQLDLVLPQGALFVGDVGELPQGDGEVVDLTELSLLELMKVRVTPEAQPDLPDLNPDDANLLPENDDGLWQGPPSHLSPEGGLTPIGVLPGTSYTPPAPPPPQPPDPSVNVGPTANDDKYSVGEDGVLSVPVATGVRANDTDPNGDPLTVSVVGDVSNGTLVLNANGSFTYTPDADFSGKDSFTYQVSDGRGGIDTATAVITVTNVNDVPVITSGPQSGAVTEIADKAPGENSTIHQQTGTITFTDADPGNVHVASANAQALGILILAVDQGANAVDWTFRVDDSDIDFLAEGETRTQTYTVTVDDKNGGTDTQDVTITLTGRNDTPTVTSGAQTGAVTEIADGAPGEGATTHQDSGTISFADVDLIDTHNASAAPQGGGVGYLGTFTLGAVDQGADTVGWTFKVDDSALDFLADGETRNQTSTVTVDDKNGGTATQDLVITLTGTNDAPTITSGAQSGAATEIADGGAGEN
ncbi:MAG: tandem-95 repeat protein, partial [Dongiaceae bacterium]